MCRAFCCAFVVHTNRDLRSYLTSLLTDRFVCAYLQINITPS